VVFIRRVMEGRAGSLTIVSTYSVSNTLLTMLRRSPIRKHGREPPFATLPVVSSSAMTILGDVVFLLNMLTENCLGLTFTLPTDRLSSPIGRCIPTIVT
jgi:hypothetical protein